MHLLRLLGSHRSESVVFPPGCHNGCTFVKFNVSWQAPYPTSSHASHISLPTVNVEVDDGRFCEFDAFKNTFLMIPPSDIQHTCLLFLQEFCSISPDAVCLFVWIPENDFVIFCLVNT